jgi:hypothetical protein
LPPYSLICHGPSLGIFTSSDAEQALGATFEASGDTPMPHFSIPDPQSPDADSNSIICTTRTILPITKRRVTAHEPPQTEAEFHFDLDPGLDCLQRNKTATKDTTDHVITWSCTDDIMDPDSMDAMKLDNVGRGRASGNGEFVRNLKVGDVVTIWGKTRYGNWVNNVEEVKIEVYWAV